MNFVKRMIALDALVVSPLNVRQEPAGSDALERLKCSIAAAGLINPLTVSKCETGYEVIAGGRRLSALQALAAEGQLSADTKVDCRVVPSGADLTRLSLMENTLREPMRPLEEFEAFDRLRGAGFSETEIASDFGITVHHVQQRLRLASVHPEIREAYRAGEITLDVLKAFGATPDQDRQLAFFKSGEHFYPHSVRAAMRRETYSVHNGRVRFIGLELYEAAGGIVERDLFTDDESNLILSSPEIVERLVAGKLEEQREVFLAAGWSFAEIDREGGGAYTTAFAMDEVELSAEDQARLDAVFSRLEALEDLDDHDEAEAEEYARLEEEYEGLDARRYSWSDEAKAASGVVFGLAWDGSLDCRCGVVPLEVASGAEQPSDEKTSSESPADQPPAQKPLSGALLDALTAMRVRTFQADLAGNPDLAFDLLLHALAGEVFGRGGSSALDLSLRACGDRLDVDQIEATPAWSVLEEIRVRFDDLLGQGSEALFESIQALEAAQKQELLAFCVAVSFRDQLAVSCPPQSSSGHYRSHDRFVRFAEEQIGTRIRSGWVPTKLAFLHRLTAKQLLAIGTEIMGENWARSRSSEKKSALVNAVWCLFDPENETLSAQQRAVAAEWLPAEMGVWAVSEPEQEIVAAAE